MRRSITMAVLFGNAHDRISKITLTTVGGEKYD
jgi:hypothetical protein